MIDPSIIVGGLILEALAVYAVVQLFRGGWYLDEGDEL